MTSMLTLRGSILHTCDGAKHQKSADNKSEDLALIFINHLSAIMTI